MHAAEWWCLVALIAAAASAVLSATAPRAVDSYTSRAAATLLAASLGALSVALWIAL